MSSDAQRMAALERANEIRFARAALKRSIKALSRVEGKQRVAAILRASADDVDSGDLRLIVGMPVIDLVTAPRRVGPAYAKPAMRRAGALGAMADAKFPVRRLTPRAARALADEIEAL